MALSSYPDHFRDAGPGLRLVRQKWSRLNTQNEHWMCVIVGQEGMGKSYTAIKVGELIDPNFSADNVYFDPAQLLENLKEGNYTAGDVWVLDEAGVGVGNRTWQDSGQKKLNQALQLVRSHNVGFVFTLPRLGELDKQARGRLQTAIEIEQKKDGEYVKANWWESEIDRMGFSKGDGMWWAQPTIDGHPVEAVKITPPSDDIIEPYEAEKQQFQEEFYDETIAELRGESQEDDEEDDELGPVEIANEIIAEGHEKYITQINGGAQQVLESDLIANDYDIGQGTAKRVKKEIKRQAGLEDVL